MLINTIKTMMLMRMLIITITSITIITHRRSCCNSHTNKSLCAELLAYLAKMQSSCTCLLHVDDVQGLFVESLVVAPTDASLKKDIAHIAIQLCEVRRKLHRTLKRQAALLHEAALVLLLSSMSKQSCHRWWSQ